MAASSENRSAEPIQYDPPSHYDRFGPAWPLLFGEEFHYGAFTDDDEPLDVATARLTDRMVSAAKIGPDLRLLDVGCGSGAQACRLARELSVSVLGITTSPIGVATASERARIEQVTDLVTFELRDGAANGLPDESFDRVWVLEASHLMREKDLLFAESARVLRPGGRLVLCDLIRHRDVDFAEVRQRMSEFVTLRDAFGDAHVVPLERYASEAASEGLIVEQLDDLTSMTRPTFERWRRNARRHRQELLSILSEDDLTAFVTSCDILERAWDDGTFGYGLMVAVKPAG